ncbi:growth factor receptor-bound protein 10 [Pangasianodon hypophthalmus]|uniref:growth factor receptor-bound protein 10 n=1 Tax=Pangasianodon hypophthalmus TaxID=310915 RepID=UPI002307E14E|nr:growth factor receptor-bound protein 10 [Pangasianodon hypophthalmus]
MQVDRRWTEVFNDDVRETMRREETSNPMKSSCLSVSPSTPRSQPLTIRNSYSSKGEFRPSSMPSIPNPFPELCSPSHSPVRVGSLAGSSTPTEEDTHVVRVFGEDTHSRSVVVSSAATAREVCHILVESTHCTDEENWALLEQHPSLGLERCLEDHEVVSKVQSSWPQDGDTKLLFRKNYAKYEFFKKPAQYFPENMISDCTDVKTGMTPSQLVQSMLKCGSCPEIQGYLHVREAGKKSWKKLYFILRRSGLYCSTKGSSKEPRHLQCVADLEDVSVYTVGNSRKLYSSPKGHTFCMKTSRGRFHSQELKLLCADSEQSKTCWVTAFRLFKYGKQLQCNYLLAQANPNLQIPPRNNTKRADGEESMVAMDFSGKSGGRVILNPREAENAEQEEGYNWRKREALRYSLPNSSHGSRPPAVHQTQPWFHGGVSRSEAQQLLEEQGQADGLFLIRDSQLHAQCFVLSLCHQRKIKHYLLIPCEEGGRQYYTMDDGVTLFIDLLQLVEFHQINRGILPVCLKHPCIRIAL